MINLERLYKKHGFNITVKEGFILLSFVNSSKTNIIVRLVESSIPLTFDDVKNYYEHFFRMGKKEQCYQYRLVCPSGFEAECEFFFQLNLALSSYDYIESLYRVNHIELFAHNDISYTKLVEQLKTTNKTCIIQPTGTGKSLILSKFIEDKPESRFIFLSPSIFIVGEIKKHLLNHQNTNFITYAKLIFLTVKEIQHLKPDYIIVDEFHRCGAEEWGSGVDLLLKTYPEAKLIGTTATHIRYLDDKRNMADELFSGNVAHHLTLSKALALNILPTPKYVSALYKFSEEYSRVKKSILSSMAEDKKVILERLNKIKLEFENTNSIPLILKEHLTEDIQKIIVFTKDIKHLRKHKPMVLDWFNSIGYKTISIYEVHSENELKNNTIFKNFEQNDNGLDIMFSVNMLNEGIHVKGVNCIIMLRDTESPIIYYQQLGRCLTVGAEKPLILDFVNNFANIRHRDFANEVGNESKKLFELYRFKGIPYQEISFEIIDKIRNIQDLLEHVELTSDHWNIAFSRLKKHKEKYGSFTISKKHNDPYLRHKISAIRQSYKKGTLEQHKIEQLESIEFNFINPKKSLLNDETISKLIEHKNKYGNFSVSHKIVDKYFYNKVHHIKRAYKLKKLSKKEINILKSIDFDFNPKNILNNETLEKFTNYYKSHGNLKVPATYHDISLYRKIGHIKKLFRAGKLDQNTIYKLESMGLKL